MLLIKNQIRSNLRSLLAIAGILIIVGILFIYSSSSVFALEKFGISYYFVTKQLIGFLCGCAALIIARLIPLEKLKTSAPFLFLGSLGLTALTLLPGISLRIHGSSRWLSFMGFGFQPSELLKIAFILYLAFFLDKKSTSLSSFTKSFVPLMIIIAIPCLLLLKQPDFGLTVTLVVTALAMLFVAQFHTKHILIALSTLIPLAIGLILYKPYRLKRILTFLDPWADPQGAGFQIIQSLIAIGSGGIFGLGVTQSKQKFFYLPMQHTDFIFSIIAEETGFIGALALIACYALFLYFGMKIVWQLKDTFCMLATFGFIILLSLQAVINLAVATGLAPTKGIGLPFVSYGNTSLVCCMAIMGLIMNMVHAQKL